MEQVKFRQTDDWKVLTQLHDDTLFVHIDATKMNRTIIQELRETLKDILEEKKMDVSFFSSNPAILKLARQIRKLDIEGEFLQDGVQYNVGTWEYDTCQ